jgi:hypothetical protein
MRHCGDARPQLSAGVIISTTELLFWANYFFAQFVWNAMNTMVIQTTIRHGSMVGTMARESE